MYSKVRKCVDLQICNLAPCEQQGSLLAGGLVFGWNALAIMLKQQNIYTGGCNNVKSGEGGSSLPMPAATQAAHLQNFPSSDLHVHSRQHASSHLAFIAVIADQRQPIPCKTHCDVMYTHCMGMHEASVLSLHLRELHFLITNCMKHISHHEIAFFQHPTADGRHLCSCSHPREW